MRSNAPPLSPVFRSTMQGQLLAATLLQPDREWTVSELAAHVDAPVTSVQGEVTRLVQAQVLASRKVGRSRLIRARTDNPLIAPLTELTLRTFGPPMVIAQEFEDVDADAVIIYGSWAARFTGVAGAPPRDLDVLVLGATKRAEVYAAADRAGRRLGIDVSPVMRSRSAWEHASADPLLDEVARRPYVTVLERNQND